MNRYRAYRDYQDVPSDWLGRIPTTWKVARLGQYFEERREKVSDKDFQPLSVTMRGVVPQLDTAAKTDAGDNRKKVCPGDFVINSRSDRKGSSGVSQLEGSVSLVSIVLRPRNIDPAFIHYLLRSQPFQEEFYRYGKGIVADLWSTNYSEMKNILIPIPSIDEQNSIAAFLDHETAKIDRLIARQERLIELLKEKRQAVISHAVTKGLNPDAPMKDSGVEWLGEVPAHWGICALGYLGKIDTGATPDRSNPSYWGGDIPWLKTGEVNYKVITESEEHITEEGLVNSSTRLAEEGTLLMAMYGQGVTRGRVAILGIKATYNQACAAIRVGKRLINEYAYFYLMAAYDFIRETGNETSQMNLSSEIIGKIKIVIPPVNEQLAIVEYLKERLPSFDVLADKVQRSIDLSKEHRTALISAAVTGKIDVRGWQKPNTEPQETATAVSA